MTFEVAILTVVGCFHWVATFYGFTDDRLNVIVTFGGRACFLDLYGLVHKTGPLQKPVT